ncbi:MAG: tetratricopeptide repeat protein [Prevotella sp.]|nr:tetratricopeptide repeat protein [Prevotella sp.]
MTLRNYIYIVGVITVLAIVGCTGCGDTKDAAQKDSPIHAGFDQAMGVADSLYNCMQFRDAYDLYLQLLDSKEAKENSGKRLSVLNALSSTSELSGHKVEQYKWLQQLLDLATQTGNDYYQSLAHITMGQNIFYEGNHEKGIQHVIEAIDLMANTDFENADHLMHGYLNLLASMYGEMNDYDNALKTNERNLQLTKEGTRWGAAQNQQLIDRRMALAKMASVLARMGRSSSGSLQTKYFEWADSVYTAWQAVQYEGNHTRDYFIVDYMKRRGLYRDAALIYSNLIQRVRQQGDTLGEMMNTAKWGLADVCQQMGRYQQAADLYEQVLVIQDTLKSRKARNTAQELAAVYHAKEQERTIMEQEAENTRQRYLLMSVIAVLLGVAILSVIVIAKNRIINRKNHALVKLIDENIKLKSRNTAPSPMEKGVYTSAAEDANDKSSPTPLLFTRISTDIREQQLYLDPSFDR